MPLLEFVLSVGALACPAAWMHGTKPQSLHRQNQRQNCGKNHFHLDIFKAQGLEGDKPLQLFHSSLPLDL
jgi:hypothetical protein